MDDSRLPWWLVVLLAIGVVGIAVWQSSHAKPQIRWGAIGLGLTYLALLGFTIGGDPRGAIGLRGWGTSQYLLAGLSGLSILAAVLLIGCAEPRGQTFWFGLVSLINAGICVAQRAHAVALVLGLIGVVCLVYLVREYRRARPVRAADLFPKRQEPFTEHSGGAFWLSVATGLVLSAVLIGSIHQALHSESTRATATRRLAALPSPLRIRSLLNLPAKDSAQGDIVDILVDQRADVVVLVAALAFLALAATFARPPNADANEEPPPEPV